MAMGKRRRHAKQATMWVATQDLPRTAGHPFYARLNQILDKHDFDGYVEELCQRFYADEVGRPGLPPGRYFRLLLIGYFEGLDAERAIAWRAADSFALREFLGLMLPEAPPDHSTISRTRRLIDLETQEAVFTWMLQRLAYAGLVKGKTVGIDATTLEANAALRSIVRRDTGESYQDFLTKLAQASGIETPTRAYLARIDRKRKKKGSNDDWTHPHDPDAKITKMKDGRTHLAHKAEHAVDLETGAIIAVTVQGADEGDTATSVETLIEAAEQIETVVPEGDGIKKSSPTRAITAIRSWSISKLSACAATSRNPIAGGAAGRTIPKRAAPSTEIVGAFAARGGNDSCATWRTAGTDANAVWDGHAAQPPGACGCASGLLVVPHSTSGDALGRDLDHASTVDVTQRLTRPSRESSVAINGRTPFRHGLLGLRTGRAACRRGT
jgi:transposase